MIKPINIVIVLSVALLYSACSSGTTQPDADPVALKAAPENVSIVGRQYYLETHLWRDFMPISPPDGKPLIALAHIIATDSSENSLTLTVKQMWVVYGRQVWNAPLSAESRPPTPPYVLEVIARDGPKWSPGVEVDVIVEIADNTSPAQLLRASKQMIFRTD